jgi:hypothetical protein
VLRAAFALGTSGHDAYQELLGFQRDRLGAVLAQICPTDKSLAHFETLSALLTKIFPFRRRAMATSANDPKRPFAGGLKNFYFQ